MEEKKTTKKKSTTTASAKKSTTKTVKKATATKTNATRTTTTAKNTPVAKKKTPKKELAEKKDVKTKKVTKNTVSTEKLRKELANEIKEEKKPTRSKKNTESLRKELAKEIKEEKKTVKKSTPVKKEQVSKEEVKKVIEKKPARRTSTKIEKTEEDKIIELEELISKILIFIIIILAILVIIGASFAFYTRNFAQDDQDAQVVEVGDLNVHLQNIGDGEISLVDAMPLTDADAKANTSNTYSFKVINSGSLDAKYTIYLNDVNITTGATRLDDSNVKYILTKNNGTESILNLNDIESTTNNGLKTRVLDSGVINSQAEITYTLKLWIKDTATVEIEGQEFKSKVSLKAEQVPEEQE